MDEITILQAEILRTLASPRVLERRLTRLGEMAGNGRAVAALTTAAPSPADPAAPTFVRSTSR